MCHEVPIFETLDTVEEVKQAAADPERQAASEGLVLETARDGTSEWVLPEHVEEFKAKGAALFEKAASS